jgi:hypothetical protein
VGWHCLAVPQLAFLARRPMLTSCGCACSKNSPIVKTISKIDIHDNLITAYVYSTLDVEAGALYVRSDQYVYA